MVAKSIVDWVKDPNTAFLLGAGCSQCAGKPLMKELTDTVLQQVNNDSLTATVECLQSPLGKPPNIEDVLNYLLGIQKLLTRKREKRFEAWNEESIGNVISQIL